MGGGEEIQVLFKDIQIFCRAKALWLYLLWPMPPEPRKSTDHLSSRGWCKETIAAEERRLELLQSGLVLCVTIEEAFAGVILGDGIGLLEAQGLDDRADAATCASYRAQDEKEDWRRITPEMLRRCNSSLCFFDPAGMRFHLPAFLCADLRGEYGFGMVFCLNHMSASLPDKFDLLNAEQRTAVRLYLLHLLKDADSDFDRPHVERALEEFWKET